jgi:hypothetical protein
MVVALAEHLRSPARHSPDRRAIGRSMLAIELLAGCVALVLIIDDWRRFLHPTASASRYGCPVARIEDAIPCAPGLAARFGPDGHLQLEHGSARWFPGERHLLLHPHAGRMPAPFRTAWPLKGAIDLAPGNGRTRLRCVKLMPWSSAVLTVAWFGVVGIGTLTFVIRFFAGDGAVTLGGLMLLLGVAAVGLLVLAFGLVTVALAYRLEDQRLMWAYEELRPVLAGDIPRFSRT